MAVDYDLVVIGNTPEGQHAVLNALHLKTRVAWVLQPEMASISANERVFSQGLSYIGELSHQQNKLVQWGLLSQSSPLNGIAVESWIAEIEDSLSENNSYASLSALGADIIQEAGEFVRKPQLSFVTATRKLRSRFYLMATGSRWVYPHINGLDAVGYLTLSDLKQPQKFAYLPQNIVVIGENSLAIEIAQGLQRLGKSISLITKTDTLLPYEDPDIVTRIQAQLEAEGIILYTNSNVTQARLIEGEKWLQVGNQAITTEEILYIGNQEAKIERLNLAGVKVDYDAQGIRVNDKLQTTHPQIYACGSVIGGYDCGNIAKYEAKTAIKNMLFLPIFRVSYTSLPYQILTTPSFVRIGLSERQAKQYYEDDIIVITHFFKQLNKAQITGEKTGLCKVITRRDGEILGAHILGASAEEMIGVFALAIKRHIKIQILNQLVLPPFIFSEIINTISLEWQQLQANKKMQNILETWFFWKRNQMK